MANAKCKLVGFDLSDTQQSLNITVGACKLAQRPYGYCCATCGTLLAIHSHGYLVNRDDMQEIGDLYR